MQDELNDLHRQVLTLFGQPFMLVRSSGEPEMVTGILRHELQPAGPMDAVMQQATTLTLSPEHALRRGDRIIHDSRQWQVDRKLHDDGHLVRWNLYAD